jgi:hypothetical protein
MSSPDIADQIRRTVAAAEHADQVASVAIRVMIRRRAEAGDLLLEAMRPDALNAGLLAAAGLSIRDALGRMREAQGAQGSRTYLLPTHDPAEGARALHAWRTDRAEGVILDGSRRARPRRTSISTFRQAVQPNSSSSCNNAAIRGGPTGLSSACGISTPIAPHALALLRARRKRPRERRAADKPDEFSSFHRITSPQARRS